MNRVLATADRAGVHARRATLVGLLAGTLCVFPSACSNAPNDVSAETSGVTVRDSAGVEIVENSGNAIPEERAWRLADEPSLSIGVTEGDEAYQLFRVAGALRLPGGGVVVVNSGTDELRFFDESGMHIKTVGGSGDGPGELDDPFWIQWYAADTLGVISRNQVRIDLFTPEGDFIRRLDPTPIPGVRPIVYGLAGRGWIVRASPVAQALDPMWVPSGEMPSGHVLLDEAGESREPFEVMSVELGAGRGPRPGMPPPPPAFFRRGTLVGAGGTLFYADARTRDIELRDLDGQVTGIIRHSIPWRPTSAELFDRYVEFELATEADPVARAARKERLLAAGFADTLPTLEELLVAPDHGTIWIRDYALPWEDSVMWTAFSADGLQLTRFPVPRRLRVLEMGSDYLLALDRDDFGIERVLMYPIIKPE